LDDAELVAVRTGLRPGSPDDLPMVGRTRLDGLVMATGHFRNGVLLTPVTAEAVAGVVTGEVVPDEVVPCDPRRLRATGVPAGPGPWRSTATATTPRWPPGPPWPTWSPGSGSGPRAWRWRWPARS